VTLPRAGVIGGKLVDEFGDPMTGALIRALRYRYVDGQCQLTPIVEGMEALLQGGVTDDLGNYRVYGLTPGDYYVCAVFVPRGESASHFGHPPTYYPGTPAATEARRISLRMGQEAANTNFNLSTARYASVSGTVVGSSGASRGDGHAQDCRRQRPGRVSQRECHGRSVHDSQRRSRGLSHTGTHGGRRNPKRRRRHGIRGTADLNRRSGCLGTRHRHGTRRERKRPRDVRGHGGTGR
jgi:hypothetical protein